MNKIELSDSAIRYLLILLNKERLELLEINGFSLQMSACYDSINEVESSIPNRFFADASDEDELFSR